MKYWLFKSEPSTYSIDDLEKDKSTAWEGVRNYQARNFLRDEVEKGDLFLFHHSCATPPGIAGVGEIASDPYPDPTQFDKKSEYYDPKASLEKPRWFLVDVKFQEKFATFVSLPCLKSEKKFEDMLVTQKGSRLSIQPVSKKHFEEVVQLGRQS